MDRQKFLKRFFLIAGLGPNNSQLYLSADCTLGAFKVFDKENFVSLGSYKLTKPLSQITSFKRTWNGDSILICNNQGIGVLRFRRAMHILRRRKYFDLGAYRIKKGKLDWAFTLSNGKNMLVLAPRIIRFKSLAIPLDSIVEKIDEKLKTWRVLTKL